MVGGPFLVFWYCFTYEIVLFLTTGDEKVAGFAQGFVKIYIWSYVTDSIHQAIGQLLDVTGHEIFTTSIDFSKSMTNVLTMVYWIESNTNINLNSIAWMYLGSSFFYLVVSSTVAVTMGWLKPFMKGMVKNPAIMNEMAIQNLLKTTIPLAFGSVVSNAEWAVLTILAGYLGPAEVSAWAILATIWMFFGSLTKGIGDAAETRIAYREFRTYFVDGMECLYHGHLPRVRIQISATTTLRLPNYRLTSPFTWECLDLVWLASYSSRLSIAFHLGSLLTRPYKE